MSTNTISSGLDRLQHAQEKITRAAVALEAAGLSDGVEVVLEDIRARFSARAGDELGALNTAAHSIDQGAHGITMVIEESLYPQIARDSQGEYLPREAMIGLSERVSRLLKEQEQRRLSSAVGPSEVRVKLRQGDRMRRGEVGEKHMMSLEQALCQITRRYNASAGEDPLNLRVHQQAYLPNCNDLIATLRKLGSSPKEVNVVDHINRTSQLIHPKVIDELFGNGPTALKEYTQGDRVPADCRVVIVAVSGSRGGLSIENAAPFRILNRDGDLLSVADGILSCNPQIDNEIPRDLRLSTRDPKTTYYFVDPRRRASNQDTKK